MSTKYCQYCGEVTYLTFRSGENRNGFIGWIMRLLTKRRPTCLNCIRRIVQKSVQPDKSNSTRE